jgi:hypothetical protein
VQQSMAAPAIESTAASAAGVRISSTLIDAISAGALCRM